MKLKFILFLLLTGCVSTQKENSLFETKPQNEIAVVRDPSKSLPKLPKVEYHFPVLTDGQAKNELGLEVWNFRSAILPDKKYVKIKYESFLKFNEWFKDTTLQLWHKPLGDGYDCDNFAHLYKSLFSVTSYKNDNIREILVGVIYVRQAKKFGGIPASDFNHALNIIGTSSGWFVYEPQTGVYDRLEHYPNNILWYIF